MYINAVGGTNSGNQNVPGDLKFVVSSHYGHLNFLFISHTAYSSPSVSTCIHVLDVCAYVFLQFVVAVICMYSTCTCMSGESSLYMYVHVHVSGSLYHIVGIFFLGGGGG